MNVKIVVFVPEKDTVKVLKTMGDVGAGVIGNYTHCSVAGKVTGRFLPGEGANPTIGEVGKFEEVAEDRIEMICPKEKAKDVIAAMKSVHPYEEVAFDIYPLISEEEL